MQFLDQVTNFAKVTVSAGYDSVATSIVLLTGDGALLPDPAGDTGFNLIWFNSTDWQNPSDDPDREIVRVTARTVDTLTITRAQEGTTAKNHNTAGKTYAMRLSSTAKTITDIDAHLPIPADMVLGNSIVFATGDGIGALMQSLTLDTVQDIRTTAAPTFGRLILDSFMAGVGGAISLVIRPVEDADAAIRILDWETGLFGVFEVENNGDVSAGNWRGTVIDEVYGGTGQNSYVLGDTLHASAANTLAKLAGNITTTRKFYSQVGTGVISAAPAWDTLTASDIPTSLVINEITNLTTDGFVKTDGTTGQLIIDTNTYLTSVTAHNLLSLTHGDTTAASVVLGDLISGNATPKWVRVAGNVTTTKKFLTQTGNGTISALPTWDVLVDADIPDILTISRISNLTSNGFVKTGSGNGTLSVDTSTYLIGNQTITLSGDVSGSGATAITTAYAGIVPMSKGGTNANLTASNGGIFYSTATAGAILAGTATAGLALVSGASTTPSWFAPTAGSVIFAGTGGILSQDNAGLFYDSATNELGVNTASPAVTLDVNGGIAFRATTNNVSSGIINDYAIGSGSFFRINVTATDGILIIKGITGGVDGKLLMIANADAGTDMIQFIHDSVNATAANRIYTANTTTYNLYPGHTTCFIYDATTQRWKQFAQEAFAGLSLACVPYVGANGTIGQDSVFTWDATNHRLGVNVGSPAVTLDVSGTMQIGGTANLGIGTATFGTSASGVLAIYHLNAPSTSPADTVQLFCDDRNATAGKGSLVLRVEDGTRHIFGDLSGINTVNPGARLEINETTLNNEVLRLISTGNAVESLYQAKITTTNASATTIFTSTPADGYSVLFEARITARRTGGTAGAAEDSAGYIVTAITKRAAGALTVIGTTTTTVGESQAGWNADAVASGGSIIFRVTGALNNNITWIATIRTYWLNT